MGTIMADKGLSLLIAKGFMSGAGRRSGRFIFQVLI